LPDRAPESGDDIVRGVRGRLVDDDDAVADQLAVGSAARTRATIASVLSPDVNPAANR
jgi:hypothetical protein